MERPVILHVRSSATDQNFASTSWTLICTLAVPRLDGVKCYDAADREIFESLLDSAENTSSLEILPTMTGQVVIAEFADGSMKAYENITRYLEIYPSVQLCSKVGCKIDHSKPLPTPPEPTAADLEKLRTQHDDGVKKIVENYIGNVNRSLICSGILEIYNKVQHVRRGEAVPDDLRKEVHNYVRLTYYKCSVVTLRNREDMGKVVSVMSIFDEAETDDTRTMLAQVAAPAPMVVSLSRVQRRTRDRDYVLHCIAVFANLKFDHEDSMDGLRARSSMYM